MRKSDRANFDVLRRQLSRLSHLIVGFRSGPDRIPKSPTLDRFKVAMRDYISLMISMHYQDVEWVIMNTSRTAKEMQKEINDKWSAVLSSIGDLICETVYPPGGKYYDTRAGAAQSAGQKGDDPNQLATDAGISKPFLNKIINRDVSPSVELLDKIARALDTTIDDIIHPEQVYFEKPNKPFVIACIRCKAKANLVLIPTRSISDDVFCGLTFTCIDCAPKVFNATLSISYSSNAKEDSPRG